MSMLNNSLNTIVDRNARRMTLASKIAEDVQFITKREKDLILSKDVDESNEYVKVVDKRNHELGAGPTPQQWQR